MFPSADIASAAETSGMRHFLAVVAVVVAIFSGIYVLYRIHIAGAVVRYRLTVDVDVDGVTHSGSGVVQVDYGGSLFENSARVLLNPQLSRFRSSVNGYAITVDLGEHGLLFVVNSSPLISDAHGPGLLEGPALDELPFYAYRSIFPRDAQRYPTSGSPSEIMERVRMIGEAKREPTAIAPKDLPMMVLLAANGARDSAEEVDPRDLAAAMGPGVRLESVTFEVTRDPVTPMPSVWPAWLKSQVKSPGNGFLRFAHQQLAGAPYGEDGIHFVEFEGGL